MYPARSTSSSGLIWCLAAGVRLERVCMGPCWAVLCAEGVGSLVFVWVGAGCCGCLCVLFW